MKYLKREEFDRANLFGAGQTNDTFSQYSGPAGISIPRTEPEDSRF